MMAVAAMVEEASEMVVNAMAGEAMATVVEAMAMEAAARLGEASEMVVKATAGKAMATVEVAAVAEATVVEALEVVKEVAPAGAAVDIVACGLECLEGMAEAKETVVVVRAKAGEAMAMEATVMNGVMATEATATVAEEAMAMAETEGGGGD